MSLPALHHGADTRSITERVNVLIREHNNQPAPIAPQRQVPAGTVLPFAGSTAPAGFLMCNGQAVSRIDYADLFAVIATTYGAGNGTTTFNLPDLQGRVVAGKEASATRLTSGVSGVNGATLGAAGGDQRMHQHNHGISDPTHSHGVNDPGHSHWARNQVYGSNYQFNNQGISRFDGYTDAALTGIWLSAAFTGISIQNNGSGASQNVQPTIVLNYVIAT